MKSKLISIREICPKPSDAVQAMIDGIKNQLKREDFRLDMTTWGRLSKNL